jgi:hypothetical protein
MSKDNGIVKLVITGQDEMEGLLEDITAMVESKELAGFIFAAKYKDGNFVSDEAGDLTVFESMTLCTYMQSKANYTGFLTEAAMDMMEAEEDGE